LTSVVSTKISTVPCSPDAVHATATVRVVWIGDS